MEIQIVKPIEFYQKKKTIISCKDVLEKYNKFFEEYNCFSENAIVFVQPVIKPVIKRNVIHKPHKEAKTVKRHMLGILNIMNTENYKKMLLKIKIYITTDNIKEIFQEIIEKCCYQIFYLQVYFQLLQDLMNSFSEKERIIALDVINEFVEEYMDNSYILKFSKTQDSYHDFCTIQRNKMLIMAKNSMIIELITKTDFVKNRNIKDYSETIFNEFLKYIKIQNEIADVLLNIMIELAKNGATFDIDDLTIIETCPKTKFLISDLVKILAQT
jgi:hypothetical protein